MAHRKLESEAIELKAKMESQNPGTVIVVKSHPRGGFLVVEQRECEKCGNNFTTAAIGELAMGGNFCRDCKSKVYEQRRQERSIEGKANQELVAEHEWRNRWEE